MSDLQFMPMFWADFFVDTMHLDGMAKGVYLQLLGNMWMAGGWIKNDDDELAKMCSIDVETWRSVKPKIRPFLVRRNGRISQRRLLSEYRSALEKYRSLCKKTAKMRAAKSPKKQKDKLFVRDTRARLNHNTNLNLVSLARVIPVAPVDLEAIKNGPIEVTEALLKSRLGRGQ